MQREKEIRPIFASSEYTAGEEQEAIKVITMRCLSEKTTTFVMEQYNRLVPPQCQLSVDIQCLSLQECDGGVKKSKPTILLMPSQSSQSIGVNTELSPT